MWKFIQQFILHPRRTGAILPSGPELVKTMLEPVDFNTAKNIVELGPGTGVFTKEILRRMRPDAKLTALEISPAFCKELSKIEDKRFTVLNADAKRLSKTIKEADYVISGLPLLALPKKDHEQILNEIKKITKYAYIQFHYSPLGEAQLKKHFSKVTKKIALKNVPPAIVYTSIP